MVNLLMQGGVMMIPILVGSVLALAIVIERFWSLRSSRTLPPELLSRTESMLAAGKLDEALTACRQDRSAVARILQAGLENARRPRAEIQEALETAGRKEAASLSSWVGALGAIAALEPLMGLLGTVLGLIAAFQEVERLKVIGNPSVVAAGVWQALITTAAGLFVAIPVFAVYRYFRFRVGRLVTEMEQASFRALQRLSRPAEGPEERR